MAKEIKKIILAYSGGLDTSIIIPWLHENYPGCEVICVAGNVGQDAEIVGLEERASTEIKLDKQIENITLTDNTGAVILKADYDLIYTPKFDEKTGKTSITNPLTLNSPVLVTIDSLL